MNLFLSFMFPKVCGICKNKINEKYTCEKCSNILQYTLKKELCVRNFGNYVDSFISLFSYSGIIRKRVLDYKFNGEAYIGCTFADLMCEVLIRNNYKFDLIIPVPIHKKRLYERGYNQSEIMSKFISKKLMIPHCAKSLVKQKNNSAQSTLDYLNRKINVIDAYKVKKDKTIYGKSILLVDDIYTTGATANECAKMLKSKGAKEVICITIAHGK